MHSLLDDVWLLQIEYHGTVVAAKNFDAVRDAERLKKAMKGFGKKTTNDGAKHFVQTQGAANSHIELEFSKLGFDGSRRENLENPEKKSLVSRERPTKLCMDLGMAISILLV